MHTKIDFAFRAARALANLLADTNGRPYYVLAYEDEFAGTPYTVVDNYDIENLQPHQDQILYCSDERS